MNSESDQTWCQYTRALFQPIQTEGIYLKQTDEREKNQLNSLMNEFIDTKFQPSVIFFDYKLEAIIFYDSI